MISMKKINLLISFFGFSECVEDRFINELINKEYISNIFMACSNSTLEGARKKCTQNVTFCSNAVCDQANYDLMCDMNELPALSKKLLEDMLPYESMIIKMGIRRTNITTALYEDEKFYYHRHLRFWNYVLEYYKVNAIFAEGFPHSQYSYVIYCLAQVKKIPVLTCSVTSIPHRIVYGTSLETTGVPICEYFRDEAMYLPMESICLTGDVAKFYEKYSKAVKEIRDRRRNKHFAKKESLKTKKHLKRCMVPFRYQKANIRVASAAIFKYHSWAHYRDARTVLEQIRMESKMVPCFLKHGVWGFKEYNRNAQEPDYSKKYIYFGLQLTPEETTIPKAGVFAEQYTSVQLIARAAAKNGVMVYVKEHFVQPWRDRRVYLILSQIPNVRLIKSTVTSYDLMKDCIAVATQTGTCILEGALQGKPALVTGSGYAWKGLPTLFEITDEDQGAEVIRNILDGFHADPDEVKRYFYAIQKCSINSFYPDGPVEVETPEFKEMLQKKISLLEKFLLEGDEHLWLE